MVKYRMNTAQKEAFTNFNEHHGLHVEHSQLLPPLKALIADDEMIAKMVLKNYLIELGFEVIAVDNGLEALDQLAKEKIDIVLTDINMPKINGIELTKQIRELNINIPIVGISAGNLQQKIKIAGMNKLLNKPISFEDLQKAVNDYIF